MGMQRGSAYSSRTGGKQNFYSVHGRDSLLHKTDRAKTSSPSSGRSAWKVKSISPRGIETGLSNRNELTLIAKPARRLLSNVRMTGTGAHEVRKAPVSERRRYPKGAGGKSSRIMLSTGIDTRAVRAVSDSAHLILAAVVVLVMFGLLIVFSAGASLQGNIDSGYSSFLTQLLWASLGCVGACVLSRLDYRIVAKFSFLFVVASIALLIAVRPFGVQFYGSRRCLHIYGPFYFQPSELAKISMMLFSAYVLHTKRDKIKQFSQLFFPTLLLLAVTCFLILDQPDLGSAVILFMIVLVVLMFSEARTLHVGIVAAIGTAIAAIAMYFEPYRFTRVLAFLNPWKDPLGYGYQLIQSYVAFGTGGIFGLGPGMSRQKFLYLPNAHNDFVFSIVGEEFGLIGSIVIVAMFVVIAVAGMKIAEHAPDQLGRILAAGITSFFVIQALVNMGGVTGLVPITGVTLPFVSAGGSSMLVCMGCLGILFNIARQVESTGGRV